jgi:hypothetical protein
MDRAVMQLPFAFPFKTLKGWLVGHAWRGMETFMQVCPALLQLFLASVLCWCRPPLDVPAQALLFQLPPIAAGIAAPKAAASW